MCNDNVIFRTMLLRRLLQRANSYKIDPANQNSCRSTNKIKLVYLTFRKNAYIKKMPVRENPLSSLSLFVPQIFQDAQKTTNHRKNAVTLRKFQLQCSTYNHADTGLMKRYRSDIIYPISVWYDIQCEPKCRWSAILMSR